MYVLPFARLKLASPADPEEVSHRLSGAVDAPKLLRWPFDQISKPFEGKISGQIFCSWPLRYHTRISFKPYVKGVLEGDPQGTTMTATVRPHLVWTTIWGVWLAFWVISAFQMVLAGVESTSETISAWEIALIVVGTYLAWMVPFNLEIRRIRKNLADWAMLK